MLFRTLLTDLRWSHGWCCGERKIEKIQFFWIIRSAWGLIIATAIIHTLDHGIFACVVAYLVVMRGARFINWIFGFPKIDWWLYGHPILQLFNYEASSALLLILILLLCTILSITITYTNNNRVNTRLINFFAHHLAPLSHTCAAHRPSRIKENQRWNQLGIRKPSAGSTTTPVHRIGLKAWTQLYIQGAL